MQNGRWMVMLAQAIYLRDLACWQITGWEPCRAADGRIKVKMTPTGVQTYVTRKEKT